jgi:hypothetical protein
MLKIEVHFHRFAVCTLLVTIWICANLSIRADSSAANLSVSIADSSGAVLQGAHLTLRNEDTNQEQQADSDRSGAATLSFLKPGRYSLTVSKNGFADIFVDRILLNVGDDKHLQLSLKVGSTAQTVNVDGSGLEINTTDASVSTVIDRKFVENIPLNGRSFQDLISITPGITTQSPQSLSGTGAIGAGGDFSVNGQRTASSNYVVDGVSANVGAGNGFGVSGNPATGGALASSTALGTTQSLVSVDALQEFRVLSSTYSAEYGHSPGGQFTFQTRSGTNAIHGTAFDYLRNNYFDANDWFNDHYQVAQPALRQNDFGGTIGGPIVLPMLYNGHNRSFFFVSYEGLRLTQPQAASSELVPDLYLRQQAPAAIQPILNVFPLPTANGIDYGTPAAPSLSQFFKSYSLPSSIDSTSVRIDHTLGQKLSAFVRAAYTPSSSQTRSLSAVSNVEFATQTYTVGATSQFSAGLSNDLRVGFARSDAKVSQHIDSFGGASPIDLATAVGAGGSGRGEGYVYLSIAGAGTTSLMAGVTSNNFRQWNLVDTVNLTRGKHALKFGFDYRHFKSPLSYSSPEVLPEFLSAKDILTNAPTASIAIVSTNGTPVFQELAAFAQDEWRARPALALSLGVRWEVNPPPTGADGQGPYTVSGSVASPSTLQIAPRGTPLWETPWYNFAPRLGLAWQAHITPDWQTVLRAGGGTFFDTDNQIAASGFNGVGFTANHTYFGVPSPLTPAQVNLPIGVTPPYAIVYAFPKRLQLPYALEWNGSLEQALGKSQSLTISYVGSNGRRQLRQNQMSLEALNPNFTTVSSYYGNLTSDYNSLQVKFQRSLTHGVQALSSYTWAHAIDYGSTYQAIYVLRGNADFDVRHTFSAALSWDLPQPTQERVLQGLFGHWGLDGRIVARSGFPVTLQGTSETDTATGNLYYTSVNYDPSKPIYLYGPQYPGGRALNGGANNKINPAFTTPTGISLGNAPRNFVRGFNEAQVNLAARREFHLFDSLSLQFRAEAFNIFNHPNFGYIDPTLTDATFGQATKMLNQSLGTVASQYQQGGPRSIQFALKALF